MAGQGSVPGGNGTRRHGERWEPSCEGPPLAVSARERCLPGWVSTGHEARRRVVSAAGGIVRRSLKRRRHHPVGVSGTAATRLADRLCRSANRSRSHSLGRPQSYRVSLSMGNDIHGFREADPRGARRSPIPPARPVQEPD